jgi:hypothetical protein
LEKSSGRPTGSVYPVGGQDTIRACCRFSPGRSQLPHGCSGMALTGQTQRSMSGRVCQAER